MKQENRKAGRAFGIGRAGEAGAAALSFNRADHRHLSCFPVFLLLQAFQQFLISE
jgi:hypothetical protein